MQQEIIRLKGHILLRRLECNILLHCPSTTGESLASTQREIINQNRHILLHWSAQWVKGIFYPTSREILNAYIQKVVFQNKYSFAYNKFINSIT
jgi:hypothetical protein